MTADTPTVGEVHTEPVPLPEQSTNRRSDRMRYLRLGELGRLLAVVWLAGVAGAAVLSPILPLPNPNQGGHGVAVRPFGERILGTDQLGRDIFARVVVGARMSLFLSLVSVGIAMALGVALGAIAGYFRGAVDTIVSFVADVILSIPGLILILVLTSLAGASTKNLVISIVVYQIPMFIRLSRVSTMSWAQREFVRAARGLGVPDRRVIVREVLPNVLPTVRAYAMTAVGVALVIEGSLSFLGFGVQPPTPVWGSMIAGGRPFLERAPHIVVVPAIVLFLTVLALNSLSSQEAALLAPRRRMLSSRGDRLGAAGPEGLAAAEPPSPLDDSTVLIDDPSKESGVR